MKRLLYFAAMFAALSAVAPAQAQISVTLFNPTVRIDKAKDTPAKGFLSGLITVASDYDLQGISFRETPYNAENFSISDVNVSNTPQFSSAVAPIGAAGAGIGFRGNILFFDLPASQPTGFYSNNGSGQLPIIRFSARRVSDGQLAFANAIYAVNVVPAPEPGVGLMMLGGMPVIGMVARRRRL